ncbi:helix-turn-helix domain-containing protein [Chryseobacterium populi]|uniref:Resolvase family protein n=1 Tax=Chryseobacterium populi TaxID=1144316 RepID=J3CAS4_9FLAO|nr:helix-turn-helix domain-containing protein [Chryseobacterium populi]EJL67794.1 resolvase family protein [Chryseobacterium populi]
MTGTNFKEIHIGKLIKERTLELDLETSRICNFLRMDEKEIEKMYLAESMDTKILLRWCKLLEYDFFRIYSQHLIFYAPPSNPDSQSKKKKESNLPQFRKNLYTKEIIDFILELLEEGEKTKEQIMLEYKIPKTTLYRWIHKK